MGALIWTALDLRGSQRQAKPGAHVTATGRSRRSPILLVQLMLGAWVAGFRAGHVASAGRDMKATSSPKASTGAMASPGR